MAKAVVGLNSDLNFDPSLQTDEVDHDFFDNPLPPSSSTLISTATTITTQSTLSPLTNTTSIATSNNGQDNNVTTTSQNPDTENTENTIGLLGISSPQRIRNSFHKKDDILSSCSTSNHTELNGGGIIISNNNNNNSTNNGIESISPTLSSSPSQQVFSTGTLLACLNNPHTELLSIDVGNGFCDSIPKEYYHQHHHYHHQNGSTETEVGFGCGSPSSSASHLKGRRKNSKKSNSNNNNTSSGSCSHAATTRIKLFDISDSSSDEEEDSSSDESDEELNNFMGKYTDYILDPASDSDITEISPMSSLTASPLPNFGDDSNHSNPATGGNLSNLSPHHHHYHHHHHHHHHNSTCDNNSSMITTTTIRNLESDPTTDDPIQMILPNLQQLQTSETHNCCDGISSIKPPSNFSGLFDEAMKSDHTHCGGGGERGSPSNSSCISSSCGSTNSANNNTSSMSLSLSSTTSRSGSSASSSCSSARKISRNQMIRNHTFTPEQMKRIERENGILLKKILDTQRHGSHHHHHNHHHHHHHSRGQKTLHRNLQCSASIARQKQLRRIDHENFILMKRLQSAKPSKLIEESFKPNNNP